RQEDRCFLVVPAGDVLAHWPELLTSRVLLAQDRHGFRPRRDTGRGANTVDYDPGERIERHRVLGILLGQLEESRRQLFRFGVYLIEDLHAFLIGLGPPESFRVALHGVLVTLDQRLILLRRRGRLLLLLPCSRQRWHGQRQEQKTP